jgi:hypothetical protein
MLPLLMSLPMLYENSFLGAQAEGWPSRSGRGERTDRNSREDKSKETTVGKNDE